MKNTKFIKNYKISILIIVAITAVLSFLIWLAIGGLDEMSLEGDIALIRIEGYISGGQWFPGITSSDEIAKFLKQARDDGNIKAVVLRVNSPGGSPAAAEEIYREIAKTKELKPVVVSMANSATSAAYYLSSSASKILALPSTEVGSIGAITLLPQFEELFKKLGIDVAVLKTGEFKDFTSPFRAKTKEEKKLVQEMLDDILEQFIERVAEGRNMDKEKVRALADGRFWTGRQAKELGLIDEFGGLNEALDKAAELAEIKKYKTVELQKDDDLFEMLTGYSAVAGSSFIRSLLQNLLYLR